MGGYEWVWPVVGIIGIMVMLLAYDALKEVIRARHRSRARIEQAMHIPPQSEEVERETVPSPEWVEGLDELLESLGSHE